MARESEPIIKTTITMNIISFKVINLIPKNENGLRSR